jgi:hypothetical protein
VRETILLREQFALDDRTFTVLAEPWFDAAAKRWRGRYLFLPVDRSLPEMITSPSSRHSPRRDELVAWLEKSTDRDLGRALRATLPAPKRRV